MTNGEKMKQIFPGLQIDEGELEVYMWTTTHDAIDIPLDWWNAEYKEPTTKNDVPDINVGNIDCISRQATINAVKRIHPVDTDYDCTLYDKVDVMYVLDEMPSVTPQERKGHWIVTAEEYYKAINEKGGGVNENTPYFTDDIACPECLAKFSVIDNEAERFDYCPNCGADLKEETE